MKAGVVVSIAGHAALLIWSVWSFAVKPLEAKSVESVPVDVISEKDFSQITAGQKNAKPAETPQKPLVEKIAEKAPVEEPTPKPPEKKEVVAAKEETPPPPPQPKVEEKKPDPKPEKKEPDQIAEALKKEAVKPPPPKPKAKPPIPVPPKFDPMKIAALLDKQEPKRVAAAGDAINRNVSLGLSSGTAATLSQSELDALRARLAQLWNPPVGAKNPEQLVVLIRVQLTREGKLAAPPVVLTSGKDPLFVAARDSAVRAIFRGQPYTMLRQETYDTWKDVEITFDPRQMFGG